MKVLIIEQATLNKTEIITPRVTITIGKNIYEITSARQGEGINIRTMNKIVVSPYAANSVDIGSGDW